MYVLRNRVFGFLTQGFAILTQRNSGCNHHSVFDFRLRKEIKILYDFLGRKFAYTMAVVIRMVEKLEEFELFTFGSVKKVCSQFRKFSIIEIFSPPYSKGVMNHLSKISVSGISFSNILFR